MGIRPKRLREYGIPTDRRVFVVAEIGLNHGGDLDQAKRLIDSAVRAGVDAVKFQTYITEKRARPDSPVFDILKKCELSFEDFDILKKHADDHGVIFFSTPFDSASVQVLSDIKCPLIKIASFDTVNLPLLDEISKTGIPVIMSCGMSSIAEIKTAFDMLTQHNKQIALLHCVSAYPTMEKDANLACIETLDTEFDAVIGQSDHTNDIRVPLIAAACGAQVIEKHFRIDESIDCIDAPVSITEKQMKQLIWELDQLDIVLGRERLELKPCEKSALVFRRIIK